MNAYFLKKTGSPEVMRMSRTDDPAPAAGQVQVTVDCIGINYAEILSRKGLYGWAPKRPYIPGMEAGGTITAVGDGIDSSRIGEKVVIGTQYGCYAEKVVVGSRRALSGIDKFTPEENAAFPVNYMTAWVALFEMGRIRPNESVLITAAAGGVGTAAVQLASAFGCKVYGMAGDDEKIELIESLGAKKGFNYRKQDYFREISETLPGVDAVLDLVGGDVYKNSMNLLNPFGRMIVAGFASLDLKKWNPVSWWKTWRDVPSASVIKMAMKSTGVMATHLGYLLDDPDKMSEIYGDLKAFVINHNIRPVIGKVFSFNDLPASHRFIESRKSMGKVVVKI